jgi:hypothetical protein
MKCRILNNTHCEISNKYGNGHNGVDVVGGGYTLDYVVAHSNGKVVFYQDGLNNMKGSTGNASYGNCVKLDHGNGHQTLYAHLQKGLLVKNGQEVKKGTRLGYMSDSGNAYGKHLHFEVWLHGKRVNPTPYLDKDLPTPVPNSNVVTKYEKGDVVTINGVYYTSTSTEKLNPLRTKGTITDIIKGARNPYLIDGGQIGWVNDDCIVGEDSVKYLSNPGYKGTSIVDGLNQINVDSSYNYRSKLAKANGISNYRGTAEQNIKMLNLLKQGKLKSA